MLQMDVGLLLLHAVVGLLLAGHGAQKLFGWFGGDGVEAAGGFLESLGWRPGRAWAILLGAAELLGGLALALGFATPVAAGIVVGVMANAIWAVHRRNGLWNTAGGYEFNLTLIAAALGLAFTGPGAYSLDAVLGWTLASTSWGMVAVGLGLLGWLVGAIGREAHRMVGARGATPRPA